VYRITVKLNDERNLFYTVPNYSREGSHIKFIDQKTGLSKSFPDNICYIEEVEE